MYLGPKILSEISEDLQLILSQLNSVQQELAFASSTHSSPTDHWPLAPELYEHVEQVLLHYPKAVRRYKDVVDVLQSTINTAMINESDLAVLSHSKIPKMVNLAQKCIESKTTLPGKHKI